MQFCTGFKTHQAFDWLKGSLLADKFKELCTSHAGVGKIILLAVAENLLQCSIQFMLLCIVTCQGRYVLLLSQARIMTCCMQYNAAAILGMSL